MNEEKENSLYRVYLIGFFLILALPLISTPVLLHPSAWGKAIIFRIILSILIFLFIYQILYKKADKELSSLKKSLAPFNWRKLFSPFLLLIILFLLFLLATIFSLDPRFSFWGSPLRGDGFLNLGLTIIFAFLIFLILKKSDWKKIWDFSILIGILVSFVAIFQQFSVFGNIIKAFEGRPPGTMGGPIFLGLYLLLLLFISLSFFLSEKRTKKKIFYLLAVLLFLYVIVITGSRAVYFGLFIGFSYFIFTWQKSFFPLKKKGLLLFSKLLFIILLLIAAFGVYYINAHPENIIIENKTIQGVTNRLSIDLAWDDPRFSAWVISADAIKDHPILGYGPENFSIAFDRYYSPSLPFITKEWGSWYDRAHSFIFEIGVTAGIPALIIYLLLFGSLFWHLQKKKDNKNPNSLIIHGIQATLFAYLAANLFSFDVFSTYLIFFLIVAYSLSLMKKPQSLPSSESETLIGVKETELKPGKPLFLSLLLIVLICFIWFGALKPLGINEEINWVNHYVRTGQCQKAVEKMERDVLPTNSIINSFAKLKYIEVVENCNVEMPGLKKALVPKTIPVLEEVKEIRPYYTRTWIFLGKYTNILIENKEIFKIKNVEELKKQADEYFERASQLSPNREDIIMGQIQGDIIQKDYLEAKEKTNQCLQLNPRAGYCWWLKILANLYLDEIEQVRKDMEIANEKDFNLISERNLYQFKMICEETKSQKCFKELADILYSLNIYEAYRYSSEHHFNLINISIKGKEEETLKEVIKNILGTWPKLESELRDSFKSIDEINIKTVNQYIDNTEKLVEAQNDLIELGLPEPEIINILRSKDEYKINQTIKLIK